MVISKPGLAQISSKYVGAPYRMGGWSRQNGFDCFSLLYIIAVNDYKMTLPKTFGGYTLDNYKDFWENCPRGTTRALIKYIRSVTDPVKKNYGLAGDVLILRGDHNIFLGMRSGTSMILSSFEDAGVTISPLKYYKLLESRRWAIL